MSNLKMKIIFFSLFFGFLPSVIFADDNAFNVESFKVRQGESFLVTIIVNSEESLNAIEGELLFPKNLVSVREIMDGNSTVNLWVKKPSIKEPGVIEFSGITPGGFNGENKKIFSIIFESKNSGEASFNFRNVMALYNDGLGTKAIFDDDKTKILIEVDDNLASEEVIVDVDSPEDFTPIISKDENAFNGEYFIIFNTQDKGSGINYYKIKEFRFPLFNLFLPWHREEGSYILRDQELKSYIVVKAVDYSGNERVVRLSPSHPLSWYDYLSIVVILISIVLLYIFWFKEKWRKK